MVRPNNNHDFYKKKPTRPFFKIIVAKSNSIKQINKIIFFSPGDSGGGAVLMDQSIYYLEGILSIGGTKCNEASLNTTSKEKSFF